MEKEPKETYLCACEHCSGQTKDAECVCPAHSSPYSKHCPNVIKVNNAESDSLLESSIKVQDKANKMKFKNPLLTTPLI